ncbi:hypothetical protein [Trinickia symbiotica]|nr:hypothetical protein [Trinickia symbiotica]
MLAVETGYNADGTYNILVTGTTPPDQPVATDPTTGTEGYAVPAPEITVRPLDAPTASASPENAVVVQTDAMGNVTGVTDQAPASGPQMGYFEQMSNVFHFVGQGAIGSGKGLVNGVPEMVMSAANAITQGAVMQGQIEAGVDPQTALTNAQQSTAGWWNRATVDMTTACSAGWATSASSSRRART